jgi:hypothetical protein
MTIETFINQRILRCFASGVNKEEMSLPDLIGQSRDKKMDFLPYSPRRTRLCPGASRLGRSVKPENDKHDFLVYTSQLAAV